MKQRKQRKQRKRREKREYPTQEVLNTLLSYDEESGQLYWKKEHEPAVGYWGICINSKHYPAHRIISLMDKL